MTPRARGPRRVCAKPCARSLGPTSSASNCATSRKSCLWYGVFGFVSPMPRLGCWGCAGAQSRAAAFRERPRHRRHCLRHYRDLVDVVFRRLAESTDDGDRRQSRRSLRQPQAALHRESGGVSVGSTVIVAANAQRNFYHLGTTLCS